MYEVGMRKSARTEQIDFKQREEERWVQAAAWRLRGLGSHASLLLLHQPALLEPDAWVIHAPDMMTGSPPAARLPPRPLPPSP